MTNTINVGVTLTKSTMHCKIIFGKLKILNKE